MVLQDDPLSALDYQVGQKVFDSGIRRLLLQRKRTVILVTHRLQLLAHAHQVYQTSLSHARLLVLRILHYASLESLSYVLNLYILMDGKVLCVLSGTVPSYVLRAVMSFYF
jgi:ABC-type phosphate/phosphonate transport system ATPase subunit